MNPRLFTLGAPAVPPTSPEDLARGAAPVLTSEAAEAGGWVGWYRDARTGELVLRVPETLIMGGVDRPTADLAAQIARDRASARRERGFGNVFLLLAAGGAVWASTRPQQRSAPRRKPRR